MITTHKIEYLLKLLSMSVKCPVLYVYAVLMSMSMLLLRRTATATATTLATITKKGFGLPQSEQIIFIFLCAKSH